MMMREWKTSLLASFSKEEDYSLHIKKSDVDDPNRSEGDKLPKKNKLKLMSEVT